MKYNKEEQNIINNWLVSVGAPYLVDEEFFEYKDGQLLEIAKEKEDSLLTWDEWQHLQTMMDMEIPLKMSIRFVGILWENNIEVLEMSIDKSKEYKEKWNKNLSQAKESMERFKREILVELEMIKMKYLKTENVLDEIDWGNGRKFKCNSYWNDDTSFTLDIGDGELTDKEGNPYFIHCEYNCNNGMWHYVFEIWFENDTCSIYDIPEPDRSEYLSETEIEELRGIIYNMCKDEINL